MLNGFSSASLLAMAMAALGLSTDFGAIRRAGARPLWLAAMLFVWLLSLWLGRGQGGGRDGASDSDEKAKITIPWFAFAFVAMVGFNSLQWLPAPLHQAITVFDTALLAMAMAALGLATDFGAIRRAGARPLWLAAMLFVWLLVGGALINHGVVRWLGA